MLLDEIEKAHPDVFNILLQVLDDGRLTDAKGRTVDFKNTVLIMTSNIGSSLLLEGVDAEGHIDEATTREVMALLKAHFKPEFLNRIDDTVLFAPLTRENVTAIIVKLTRDLCKRLEEQEMYVTLSDDVKEWIAENAYDPIYGARPLKRFITREIETPLAKAVIKGTVQPQQKVFVDLSGDHVTFRTEPQQTTS